jgi:hypothetical protein
MAGALDDDDLHLDLAKVDESTWLAAFKAGEQQDYQAFCTEEVKSVQMYYVFINSAKEVERVAENTLNLRLHPGVVEREQLVACIKEQQQIQSTSTKTHYKIMSLLRFNVDLTTDEVMDFVEPGDEEEEEEGEGEDIVKQALDLDAYYQDRFFRVEKQLEEVRFPHTIAMFNDLNALVVVFKATATTTSKSSTAGLTSPMTRKIKLHKKFRGTKRV